MIIRLILIDLEFKMLLLNKLNVREKDLSLE